MKGLRQERNWSQEQLAELSGLSLRTIQRIEGSNTAGSDSLAALAAAFDIEVVALERELAMDKSSSEWKKRPAWVRGLFFGSGRIQMDKPQQKRMEVISLVAGTVFAASGMLGAAGILVRPSATVPLLVFGSLMFLAAYLTAVIIRVGDQHGVWPWVDSNAKTNATISLQQASKS
jgi:transcriptional regulator with XRE-family HTH domain